MKKLTLAVALVAFVGASVMANDGKENGKSCCSKKATTASASCCKDKTACHDTKAAAAKTAVKAKTTSVARKAA